MHYFTHWLFNKWLREFDQVKSKGFLGKTKYVEKDSLVVGMHDVALICIGIGEGHPQIAMSLITRMAISFKEEGVHQSIDESIQELDGVLDRLLEKHKDAYQQQLFSGEERFSWQVMRVALADALRRGYPKSLTFDQIPLDLANDPTEIAYRTSIWAGLMLWGLKHKEEATAVIAADKVVTFPETPTWNPATYREICAALIKEYQNRYNLESMHVEALPSVPDEVLMHPSITSSLNGNPPPPETGLSAEGPSTEPQHTVTPRSTETSGESTCRNCGHANPVSDKFCGGCGEALPIFCSSCSAENRPENQFCGQCGTNLKSD